MSELICTLGALKAACRRATQEMDAMRAASLERLVFSREALRATAPHVRAGTPPWPQDVSWNRTAKLSHNRRFD
jgi:hypothetical protein